MAKLSMRIRNTILLCILLLASSFAWSNVFVHWTSSALPPPAKQLGLNDLVLSWNDNLSSQVAAASKEGYRVYVEASLHQAAAAAESGSSVKGIILRVPLSERAELEKSLPKLRSGHPKARFLVLNPDGKQPEIRGSLVIKRGTVLEVSSPTAQPWIDANLALVRIEQRSEPGQLPMYTFSWQGLADSGAPQTARPAEDYLLAVAEAGAFHADLILNVEESLQKALAEHNPRAWALWNQVRAYAGFYSRADDQQVEAAANVAVIVDVFDTSDEVMNLLARHNIPFKVLRPADLESNDLQSFEVVVVLTKADRSAVARLADLARHGKTVVVVEAHGPYPWQNGAAVRLNETAVSYSVGTGKVLELSEAVTDPETFAQDIRRLLGNQNALMTLWNGLTTIAVPYPEHGPTKVMELVNYSAEPLRLQVQVQGSFSSVRYETPEHPCCESLVPVKHDGFTEFVIPDLRIAGRAHLETNPAPARPSGR